jgi:hypothetical protein
MFKNATSLFKNLTAGFSPEKRAQPAAATPSAIALRQSIADPPLATTNMTTPQMSQIAVAPSTGLLVQLALDGTAAADSKADSSLRITVARFAADKLRLSTRTTSLKAADPVHNEVLSEVSSFLCIKEVASIELCMRCMCVLVALKDASIALLLLAPDDHTQLLAVEHVAAARTQLADVHWELADGPAVLSFTAATANGKTSACGRLYTKLAEQKLWQQHALQLHSTQTSVQPSLAQSLWHTGASSTSQLPVVQVVSLSALTCAVLLRLAADSSAIQLYVLSLEDCDGECRFGSWQSWRVTAVDSPIHSIYSTSSSSSSSSSSDSSLYVGTASSIAVLQHGAVLTTVQSLQQAPVTSMTVSAVSSTSAVLLVHTADPQRTVQVYSTQHCEHTLLARFSYVKAVYTGDFLQCGCEQILLLPCSDSAVRDLATLAKKAVLTDCVSMWKGGAKIELLSLLQDSGSTTVTVDTAGAAAGGRCVEVQVGVDENAAAAASRSSKRSHKGKKKAAKTQLVAVNIEHDDAMAVVDDTTTAVDTATAAADAVAADAEPAGNGKKRKRQRSAVQTSAEAAASTAVVAAAQHRITQLQGVATSLSTLLCTAETKLSALQQMCTDKHSLLLHGQTVLSTMTSQQSAQLKVCVQLCELQLPNGKFAL